VFVEDSGSEVSVMMDRCTRCMEGEMEGRTRQLDDEGPSAVKGGNLAGAVEPADMLSETS
jgi:hypothetical protein